MRTAFANQAESGERGGDIVDILQIADTRR